MSETTIPKAIQVDLDALDKRKAETLKLADVAAVGHAVADVFPALGIEVSIVRWTGEPPFVFLRLDVASFEELLPIFRDLASRGWHTNKKEPFSDYHELDRRTYNLAQDGETVCIDPVTGAKTDIQFFYARLRLMVFVRKENAKCHKVQTGTKTEPVYEWVCDEAEVHHA